MIEGLRQYPAYKDFGLPWLSFMPEHWKLDRMKSLIRKIDIRSMDGKEELLTVSSARGVIPRKSTTVTMFQAKSYKGYKLCWPNDLVINSLWAWAGGLGVSRHHGIISSAYGVYRVRESACMNPGFLHEVVRSAPFNWELQIRSKGIWISRLQLTDDALLNAPMYIPPPDEQAAIVRFLDHANRRIDRFIRAKKKLIALLNEQKQAIIHRAVTRGLDPNVPMKDSGVPWLGEIPAHWEVKRIKCLLREVDVRSTNGQEPLLSVRMHHGIVLFAEHFSRPPQAASLTGFKVVWPGQIVVNRMQAGNGVIFPSELHGLVSPDYAVLDPICDANVNFLGELFRSHKIRAKFRSESKGLGTGSSGFLRLYSDRLGAIHIGIPSRSEQDEILSGLDDRLEELKLALSRTEHELSLIREYRTRLIADVVTGQLDVREAAAGLPAESDEPVDAEALDEDDTMEEPDEEGEALDS